MKNILLFLVLILIYPITNIRAQSPTPYALFYQYVDPSIVFQYAWVEVPGSSGNGLLLYDGIDTLPNFCTFGNGISYDHTNHVLSIDYGSISGKPSLGTAAYQNSTVFATSSQGIEADNALQPVSIGVSVQGYSSNLNLFATNGSSYYLSRSNATGTQIATTISDFSSAAISAVTWTTLTGKPTTISGYGITDPIVLTSGSYANPAWITSLAYSKLTGAPSLATVATTGIYSDLTGKPSIPSAQIQSDWTQASSGSIDYIKNKPPVRSQSSATHTFVSTSSSTGFQISSTRDSNVYYNVTIAVTASIGSQSQGSIALEIAATNSTTPGDWTEISRFTNGQNLTIALAVQSVQTIGSQLSGFIPAGYYARIRTIATSGTPTNTYVSGQEVLL